MGDTSQVSGWKVSLYAWLVCWIIWQSLVSTGNCGSGGGRGAGQGSNRSSFTRLRLIALQQHFNNRMSTSAGHSQRGRPGQFGGASPSNSARFWPLGTMRRTRPRKRLTEEEKKAEKKKQATHLWLSCESGFLWWSCDEADCMGKVAEYRKLIGQATPNPEVCAVDSDDCVGKACLKTLDIDGVPKD